jgi:hypothetical protein
MLRLLCSQDTCSTHFSFDLEDIASSREVVKRACRGQEGTALHRADRCGAGLTFHEMHDYHQGEEIPFEVPPLPQIADAACGSGGRESSEGGGRGLSGAAAEGFSSAPSVPASAEVADAAKWSDR